MSAQANHIKLRSKARDGNRLAGPKAAGGGGIVGSARICPLLHHLGPISPFWGPSMFPSHPTEPKPANPVLLVDMSIAPFPKIPFHIIHFPLYIRPSPLRTKSQLRNGQSCCWVRGRMMMGGSTIHSLWLFCWAIRPYNFMDSRWLNKIRCPKMLYFHQQPFLPFNFIQNS